MEKKFVLGESIKFKRCLSLKTSERFIYDSVTGACCGLNYKTTPTFGIVVGTRNIIINNYHHSKGYYNEITGNYTPDKITGKVENVLLVAYDLPTKLFYVRKRDVL